MLGVIIMIMVCLLMLVLLVLVFIYIGGFHRHHVSMYVFQQLQQELMMFMIVTDHRFVEPQTRPQWTFKLNQGMLITYQFRTLLILMHGQ
jgi:hypothetical protein